MKIFFATLSPMLTLFACMAIGFIMSKAKVLPDSSSKVMARLETWVFCPALNFVTMARYCTIETLSVHAVNVIMASISVAISMGIAILASRFFVKERGAERGIYSYALAFANSGYIGDPIVLALFGESVLAYYKLFCLPLTLVIYTWGISVLTPKQSTNGSVIKRLLNAPTVAMLAGIAFGLSGAGECLPGFAVTTLDSLKACMGPVGMLLAGVTIAKYNVLEMLKNVKVYIASFLRLIVIPTVVIAVLWAFKTFANQLFNMNIDNDVLFLCLFALAAPLGLNTVVFPEAYGGDPKTGAAMTMISHTLCVVTIPLMYAFATGVLGAHFVGL